MRSVLIKEILTKEVFFTDQNESVARTIELMKETHVGSVIVMGGGVPVGIITERDIVKSSIIGSTNFMKLSVKDIMSKPLISISQDTTIEAAADIMRDKNIKKLVVKGYEDAVVGIITQTDIVYNVHKLL